MPCHCRSTLTAFTPTMSTEAQRNISSLYKWETEAWNDIVVYTQQPHELPVGQDLQNSCFMPFWGKGYDFKCSAGYPQTRPTCTGRTLGSACRTVHEVQSWAATTSWHVLHCCSLQLQPHISGTREIPSGEMDWRYFSCYIEELPERISTIKSNTSRPGENSFSTVCIKIFIYQCKALLWTTFGVIYMKSILINHLLKGVLIINC